MNSTDTTLTGPKNKADLILAIVQALRIKQWIKNLLLFAALIFALKFKDIDLVIQAVLGFCTFCMISSAGYLYNDSRDREADAQHPRKCKRPIASGRLPLKAAYVEMVFLLAGGFGIAWTISPMFALVTLLYLCTTLSYTFFFKHHVILDVMFISAGFLWRAAAGAVAIDVTISPWLLTCTAFLTLFIGFNKRRSELGVMAGKGNATRKNLMHYTPELLVEFQAITTSGTVISYALYTVLGSPSQWLLLTLPYVLYGIFRYIFLVTTLDEGEEPADTLLRDMPLLATVALYCVTVVGILLVTRVGI
jgi:4-hydroxybenzoate polyprenyltransferase